MKNIFSYAVFYVCKCQKNASVTPHLRGVTLARHFFFLFVFQSVQVRFAYFFLGVGECDVQMVYFF